MNSQFDPSVDSDLAPGRCANTYPRERGEAYVAAMRNLAEASHDPAVLERRFEELVRIIRPFGRMGAEDLYLVLRGIDVGLQSLLDELVVGPRGGPFRELSDSS